METTRLIVFEGFADTEPEWEFDIPVYMIHPVKREGIGGVGNAEDMVESYIIDLSCGDEPESEEGDWRSIMRQFRASKAGSERFVYWRQEVRVPGPGADEDAWDTEVETGPLQVGATPAPELETNMTEWNPNGDDDRPVPPVDPAVQARFDERVARRASQAPETEGERHQLLNLLRLHHDARQPLSGEIVARIIRYLSRPAPERERVAEALFGYEEDARAAYTGAPRLHWSEVPDELKTPWRDRADHILGYTGATLTREER